MKSIRIVFNQHIFPVGIDVIKSTFSLYFFSFSVTKTKNNKGRNLYKLLFIVLPVLNLLKTRIFYIGGIGTDGILETAFK